MTRTKNRTAGKAAMSRVFLRLRNLALVVVPACVIIAGVYLLWVVLGSSCTVKKIVFSGNAHLTDEELKAAGDIRGGENLFLLSGSRIFSRMAESPWIRSVTIRKELPDTLHVLVKEAEPFALLDMKGRLFIVDDKGKMLEELKDSQVPFLPVITGNPFQEKEGFSEAIALARAIKESGALSRKNHIEIIARRPQDLSANIDGTVVKVGAGEYREKLERLAELEEEIKRRGIPVDYVDLRFANRVVVKAVNEVVQ